MSRLEELKFTLESIQLSEEERPKSPVTVNFGIVVYPGFQPLDAFGPLDALSTLSLLVPLNLSILAETLDSVSTKIPGVPVPHGSDFSLSIVPTHTFAAPPPLDVLLVPGGLGGMCPSIQSAIAFVADIYPSLQYLVTVCNGAVIAALARVLDGKRATTNKLLWTALTVQRPQVKWVAHARWVVDGNLWTSSGASAGMDVTLAFVATTYGEAAAEKVAHLMEYERHRDPNWDPFAEIYNLPHDA